MRWIKSTGHAKPSSKATNGSVNVLAMKQDECVRVNLVELIAKKV